MVETLPCALFTSVAVVCLSVYVLCARLCFALATIERMYTDTKKEDFRMMLSIVFNVFFSFANIFAKSSLICVTFY